MHFNHEHFILNQPLLSTLGLSVMVAISGPGPSEGDVATGPQTRLAYFMGLILTRELPESLTLVS